MGYDGSWDSRGEKQCVALFLCVVTLILLLAGYGSYHLFKKTAQVLHNVKIEFKGATQ